MPRSVRNEITTYADCVARIGNKDRVKLAGNVWLERLAQLEGAPDSFGIRFYATTIVTYHATGAIVLAAQGHQTVTTKRHLNRFSPASIWQRDYTWYVAHDDFDGEFYDGVSLQGEQAAGASR